MIENSMFEEEPDVVDLAKDSSFPVSPFQMLIIEIIKLLQFIFNQTTLIYSFVGRKFRKCTIHMKHNLICFDFDIS